MRSIEDEDIALLQLIDDLNFDVNIQYHIMRDGNKERHLESFLLSVLDDEQKQCLKNLKNATNTN